MLKFHLHTEQILQGSFTLQPLNLILVFQVNCPGCFIYALPLASMLHEKYRDRVNVLGLSTAFEDFEFNTADNTKKLLQSGEMVGVTQSYFEQQKISHFSVPLDFPVAFDSKIFQLNALPGTPCWLLINNECEVLSSWFGHKKQIEVEYILHRHLNPSEQVDMSV